ncbi:MAG: GNAT family N-acetyltransferase [Mycobacteriales bacterium]
MLRGELVTLRTIERDDLEVLHAIDMAYETWPETNYSPYAPKSLDEVLKAFDGEDESSYRGSDSFVPFAIVADEEVVGTSCFWGIDLHNRRAHLGIGLGEEHRGRGIGTDATRVMLHYGFVDRGLHRVQLEVLATNIAAIRCYEKAGFREDGRMRESAWVRGAFVDEIYMSVIAGDR